MGNLFFLIKPGDVEIEVDKEGILEIYLVTIQRGWCIVRNIELKFIAE